MRPDNEILTEVGRQLMAGPSRFVDEVLRSNKPNTEKAIMLLQQCLKLSPQETSGFVAALIQRLLLEHEKNRFN